jgi:DNA-binding transcriptional ArsR family regulator
LFQLPKTFSALGDPVRFAIVERLLRDGELSAGELQNEAEISPPAISRHLRVLREAGIVRRRSDKQKRMYSANPDAVRAIGAWSLSHREFWQTSLNRLEKALMQEKESR